MLNSGQNFIFSSALTMMMLLAAQGIVKGELCTLIASPIWTCSNIAGSGYSCCAMEVDWTR